MKNMEHILCWKNIYYAQLLSTLQLIKNVTSTMMSHNIDVMHFGILIIVGRQHLKPEAHNLHGNILELTAALFGLNLC